MDVLSAIAIVSGLTGAVLGGLGWWKARSAMAAAAACHKRTLERGDGLPRVPGDEQGDGGRSIASLPGVQTARAEDVVSLPIPQAGGTGDEVRETPTPIDAKTAALVVRPGSENGHALPTNQGSGSGLLGVFVVNQGPGVAHELRLDATFPDGAVRSSETHRTLSAHKEMTLFAQVLPQDFGPGSSVDVLYRVAYRDGNGEQTLERKVRLDGGWKGPWKTFIDAESGAAVVRLGGNAAPAPELSPTRD